MVPLFCLEICACCRNLSSHKEDKEYVLNEACRQNKIWQDMGLPKIIVSVNLTSADFYQEI